MVQLDERAGEVESDAGAHIAVVHIGGRLVEAFEDAFQFVGRNGFAVVGYSYRGVLLVVAGLDEDDAASGCELESVGEQVHHHLVEVGAVYPHRQCAVLMLEEQLYLLGLSLVFEKAVYIVEEPDEVGFLHAHLHHSLVDFPEVHHLVDESEYTLCVAAHSLVDTLPLGVFVFFDERVERCENKCHRCADLMADVHEGAQLGLAQLLGVDMLLEPEPVALLTLPVEQILAQQQPEDGQVDEIRPPRLPPRVVHHDGELEHRCGQVVVRGSHLEAVGTRREVREGDFVLSRQHAHLGFIVDAVGIGDVLGVVVGQCGELQGEGIVAVAQMELSAGHDGGVAHLIVSRLGLATHGLAVEQQCGQFHRGLPHARMDVGGVEPGDAPHSTEEHGAVGAHTGGAVAELVRLESVVHEISVYASFLGFEAAESVVGGNPEASGAVFLNRGDTVFAQSLLVEIVFHLSGLQVIAVEAVVGAYPQYAVELAHHPGRLPIEKTVLAEGGEPASRLEVEARHAHGGGCVDTSVVGRQRHLCDVVVDDAVHFPVVVGPLFHVVGLHSPVGGVEAEQSVAHGGEPHMSLAVVLEVEHAHRGSLGQNLRVILSCIRVNPSTSLLEAAYPYSSGLILVDGEHGRGQRRQIMVIQTPVGSELVESVFVGTDIETPFRVDERAGDTGIAYEVLCPELISHILESRRGVRVHVDTLLQHAEPEVSALVLCDGHHLGGGDVHIAAHIGVHGELVGGGIEDADAVAVETDEHMAAAVQIEVGHLCVAHGLQLLERAVFEAEHAQSGGGGIDTVLPVLTEV